MSTVPFPITLTFLSFTLISTILIPAFFISSANSFVITSSFCTRTSPVSGSIMSLKAIWFAILVAIDNFWLNN